MNEFVLDYLGDKKSTAFIFIFFGGIIFLCFNLCLLVSFFFQKQILFMLRIKSFYN